MASTDAMMGSWLLTFIILAAGRVIWTPLTDYLRCCVAFGWGLIQKQVNSPRMMNYNWFVGQNVVCIDGRFPGYIWEWCDAVPVAGLLYTIRREIFSRNHSSGVMCLSFHLEEIINPEVAGIGEAAFHFARF